MKQVTATVISNAKFWGEYGVQGRRKYLGAWLLWLKCPEVAAKTKPGQFIMVNCAEEYMLPRPLSIHQVNNTDIALFFAVLENGKGTNWLSQRKVSDNIDLLGPLGNGYSIRPSSQKLLLLAGGVGIAPLYFLAQAAITKQYSVTLIHGATSKLNLYPEKIPPEIELVTVTEDGSAGEKGMITDLLPDFTDWADQIFACGPLPMYKAMTQMPELKDKPIQVSLEVRMGCGRGVCYGCTVKTKRGLKQVCRDGPVFNLDDVLWDEIG